MDNFKIIYKILSVLEKSMDLECIDTERISSGNLSISQQRWDKYMEMLLDAGYIKGVSIKKYTDGEMRVDIENIRITLKGLEYLSENSIMQRMYNATKGITDLIPWYHPFERVSGIFVPIFKKGKVKNYDESNVITANGRKNRWGDYRNQRKSS